MSHLTKPKSQYFFKKVQNYFLRKWKKVFPFLMLIDFDIQYCIPEEIDKSSITGRNENGG
jgi:hypothetical protein